MKFVIAVLLWACSSAYGLVQSDEKIVVYDLGDSKAAGNGWLLLDTKGVSGKNRLAEGLNEVFGKHLLFHRDSFRKTGSFRYLLVPKNNNSGPLAVSRDRAKKDCLIGAAMCVGGCLVVNIAGKSVASSSPDGFYAVAGDKFVDGPAACLVGRYGFRGCS